ncbi:nucleotidyltransferase domain-containing protein [Halomonas campisalis]|uniref:Nucleotidyltransferase domain-containing protein n=1 Tax=Billgrantia campisalis TaxID=74661 RepID=A0ABS9P8F6_9GAMM|nr:nucleotidyltransferase domain-containing protein [Halomonas campisalis]MCG6658069.1 nucleotidyltransferase domain-containing protein [Halomonas campisalis]MDR5862735.1 nucleotidyltransferase domain-containing protein [Halomonas campisalis]
MRLTDTQVDAIKDAVAEVLGPDARVYLFGSRVDDSRRGGDIDLYIEVHAPPMPGWLEAKVALQRCLWERLGPQRIDLLIRSDEQPLRPIHRDALQQGVRL